MLSSTMGTRPYHPVVPVTLTASWRDFRSDSDGTLFNDGTLDKSARFYW
jgi:hypothetical protein